MGGVPGAGATGSGGQALEAAGGDQREHEAAGGADGCRGRQSGGAWTRRHEQKSRAARALPGGLLANLVLNLRDDRAGLVQRGEAGGELDAAVAGDEL